MNQWDGRKSCHLTCPRSTTTRIQPGTAATLMTTQSASTVLNHCNELFVISGDVVSC